MATSEKTALLPQHHAHLHQQQHELGFGIDFWTSIFPQNLIAHFSSDIHRLSWVLQVIRLFLPVFYFLPLCWMLWLFRFTPEFGEEILYPLITYFADIKDDAQTGKWASCGMLYKVFSGMGGRWDVESKAVSTSGSIWNSP